jgi:hypothetical protein
MWSQGFLKRPKSSPFGNGWLYHLIPTFFVVDGIGVNPHLSQFPQVKLTVPHIFPPGIGGVSTPVTA